MADQQYTIEFQTISDVSKAENLKRALEGVAEAQKKLGQDATAYEAQAKNVEQALDTQAAKALKLDEALRKAADSARQQGIDPSAIDAQRAANRQTNGLAALGTKDNLVEKAKEIYEAYKMAGSGIEGLFAALAAGGSQLLLILVAVKTAFDLINKSVQEFAQAEEAMASLDQSLRNIGEDTDAVRDSFKELAGAMEEATNIQSTKWVETLTKLTQFGSLPETINRDAEAVKNLTGITGDLGTATMLITRALQGHFQAFTRYGIVVEDAGSKTEKLEKLYEQLATRGAGMLEARAATLTGQFDKLKVGTNNVLEGIGNLISRSGLAQEALNKMSMVVEALNYWLPKTIPSVGGLNDRLAATANNAASSADQMKRLQDEIKNTAEATERLNTHLSTQLQIQQNLLRLRDEESNSQMARALANVDSQVAAGRMRPEVAASARVNIREHFRALQDANRATGIAAQIRTTEEQRDNLRDDSFWAAENQQAIRDQYSRRDEQVRALAGRRARQRQLETEPGASPEQRAAAQSSIQLIDREASRLPQLVPMEQAMQATQQIIDRNSAQILQLEAQLNQLRTQQTTFEFTRVLDRETRGITGQTEVDRATRSGSREDIASQLERLNTRINDAIRGGTDPVGLFEQRRRLQLRDLNLQPEMREEERRNQREQIQRNYRDSIINNRFDPQTGQLRPMTSNIPQEQLNEMQQTLQAFVAFAMQSTELLRGAHAQIGQLNRQIQQDRTLTG